MISLEQVRALEDRVEKAVAYIASLREEGAELRRLLAEAQSSMDDAAKELAEAEEKYQAAEKRADAAVALREADSAKVRDVESRLGDMAERVAAAEAQLSASETRAAELSARAEEYRKDQAKIEEGIVHALEKLDSFEDLVLAQAPAAEKGRSGSAKAAPKADSGIAVKEASDLEGGSEGAETLENELDIF